MEKRLVVLRSLVNGAMFYTTNEPGKDMTATFEGEASYEVLGYADNGTEAMAILRANGWAWTE